MSSFLFVLMQIATLAYALIGGVFLAFSDFIMRSLAITGGPATMQVINREVFHWIFMALFLGMAGVSLLIVGYAAISLSGPGSTLILLSGIIYLIGCFGVTVFFNVPMNEALAGMEPDAEATLQYWIATYGPRWAFWNSIRSIACAISAAFLLFGLMRVVQSQQG
ncbi:hypothetical protein C1J03_22430 [Sulfitobacter sp. SK012]|uniref:anthrone oxygenase family protein n=1 Tax=Sulfitobacter sp. SK012 TaxID=1389005 RepID=UPI000E0B9A7F|nr:anthrone oxygenase family protein [Sulfitobacter sp. SK012]AXI48508.1 hypothetical protein C1J03_22430 [Sulfitobacter sp. SK012]